MKKILYCIAIMLVLSLTATAIFTKGHFPVDVKENENAANPHLCPGPKTELSIWEAQDQGLLDIISYGGDFNIVNYADLPIVINDYVMLMSPHVSGNGSTQDGVLTPHIIPPQSTFTYDYGSVTVDHPELRAWWCTEFHQSAVYNQYIMLNGEIAPLFFQEVIESDDPALDEWHGDFGVFRNYVIWYYVEENPTLVIGKTPFTAQSYRPVLDVEYTLTVTNIGRLNATNIIVQDIVPKGFTLKRNSFSLEPTTIERDADRNTVITWIIPVIEGYHENFDPTGATPIPYLHEQITYTAKAHRPKQGPVAHVPGATVHWQDSNSTTQSSYSTGSEIVFYSNKCF